MAYNRLGGVRYSSHNLIFKLFIANVVMQLRMQLILLKSYQSHLSYLKLSCLDLLSQDLL